MAAGSNFGCPKITLCRISYHFRSIPQFFFCEIFLQNGCRRPFWMSENHFRSHFWPFQINTETFYFLNIYKMASGTHLECPKFTFDRISGHFRSIRNFILLGKFLFLWIILQNGCRRPFWMSENHFRSHFWPFQINTTIYFLWNLFTKWLPAAILDVRKSLSVAFLAISDQYRNILFFKYLQNGRRHPFGMSEIHFRSHFWPFQIDTQLYSFGKFLFLWFFFTKWLPWPFWMSEIHFGSHFWPFEIFFFWNFWQNGCRQPFWMSEIHFGSHFWTF